MLTVFGAARSEAITVNLTFDDLNEQLWGFVGSGDFDFVITNSSGVTWTDFHLETRGGVGAFVEGDYSGPGTATYVPAGVLLGVPLAHTIDITGISVADGGT
jgi:hypothetical protein